MQQSAYTAGQEGHIHRNGHVYDLLSGIRVAQSSAAAATASQIRHPVPLSGVGMALPEFLDPISHSLSLIRIPLCLV